MHTIKSYALACGKPERTVQRWIQKFNEINNANLPYGRNDEIDSEFLQGFLDEKSGLNSKIQKAINGIETEVKLAVNEKQVVFDWGKSEYLEKVDYVGQYDFEYLSREIQGKEIQLETLKEKFKYVETESTILRDTAEEFKGKISSLQKYVHNLESENENLNKKITSLSKKNLQEKLSSDWLIVIVLLTILCADMIAFSIIGHNSFKDALPYPHIIFAVIGLATGIGSIVTYNRIEKKAVGEFWKWLFGVLQFCVFSFATNESWRFAETTMTIMFVLVFVGVQRSIKK